MEIVIPILVLLALAGWLLSSGGSGPKGRSGSPNRRNCTCRTGNCFCR